MLPRKFKLGICRSKIKDLSLLVTPSLLPSKLSFTFRLSNAASFMKFHMACLGANTFPIPVIFF